LVSGLLSVTLVCFVLRLLSMPVSRRVVAAPRWFVASCAFVGMKSQGLARPPVLLIFRSLLRPRRRPWCVSQWTQKWVFLTAFREKTHYRDAPSYAKHPVFTCLGEIKQPYTRPLSD